MKEIIRKLEEINSDDARFIINVLVAKEKRKISQEMVRKKSKIVEKSRILLSDFEKVNEIIYKNENNFYIDLDKIWAKPYLFRAMRLKLDYIVNEINKADKIDKKFCHNLVLTKIEQNFEKPVGLIDIVDFINEVDVKHEYIFMAEKLDEETLFKEEQLNSAFEVKKLPKKDRLSKIYDKVYDYLDSDFIKNNYCDFINDKCVAQRRIRMYPVSKTDGCCFMEIRRCPHLGEHGACDVRCLPCRLFACPFLGKRGIGYLTLDFVLLKAFTTRSERRHLVFDFYQSKDEILKKALK